jgi:glycosyltransferase involved in cell wall biosynthesis
MRIGFLTFTFYGNSGSSVYARSLIKSLCKNKNIDDVTILTIGSASKSITEDFMGNKIINVRCELPSHLKRYEFAAKMKKYIDVLAEEKIDLVHAQHSFEGMFADEYKKRYNVPFVFVREVVSKFLPNFYSKYILFNLEKYLTEHLNYDVLVSWSQYMVDQFFSKWKINPEKIRVIQGGVDMEKFNPNRKFSNIRSKYGIDQDDFLLFSVKVFSSSNVLGLINSIKAFEIFARDKDDAKYLIGGGGPGKKMELLKNLVKKLGLENKVILMGRVEWDDLINYYRSSDATVHFFMYDASISVSLMESLACGIPIITTNVGEVPNLVNNKVGILVNQSHAEMADAMQRMYENGARRKQMGRSAIYLVKEKFDIDVVAKRYIELYEELLKR